MYHTCFFEHELQVWILIYGQISKDFEQKIFLASLKYQKHELQTVQLNEMMVVVVVSHKGSLSLVTDHITWNTLAAPFTLNCLVLSPTEGYHDDLELGTNVTHLHRF
jgi:hypothetical protein